MCLREASHPTRLTSALVPSILGLMMAGRCAPSRALTGARLPTWSSQASRESMEQKDSPSQRRFDRKVGFAQKLHNEASGEPDLATGLTSSPRATFDVIAQARLTGRLEPGSLHFVLDNSYGEDEGRGQEGRAFTLNDEASNCLTKVQSQFTCHETTHVHARLRD